MRLMNQPTVSKNRCRLMSFRPASGISFNLLASAARRGGVTCSATTAVLALSGEIDLSNCSDIPIDVEKLCRQGCQRVRLDLGDVSFIDATAVSAFLEARRRAQGFGCEVVLGAVGGSPLRVVRLLELDTVFAVEAEQSDE